MQSVLAFATEGGSSDWHSAFSRTIEQQRLRTLQFLAGHSRRLADLESQLKVDVENVRSGKNRLFEETGAQEKRIQDLERALEKRQKEAKEKERALAAKENTLHERDQAFTQWENRLKDQEGQILTQQEALRENLEKLENDSARLRSEQADQSEKLNLLSVELHRQQEELRLQRETLDEQKNLLSAERNELTQQRDAQEREAARLEQVRCELDHLRASAEGGIDEQVRLLSVELESSRKDLLQAKQAAEKLQAKLEAFEDRQSATVVDYESGMDTRIAEERAEWEKRIAELTSTIKDLTDELEQRGTGSADIDRRLAEQENEIQLALEAKRLVELRLTQLQDQLATASGGSADLVADYQIRAEIAESELASARAENQKLQERLISARNKPAANFDWEARKKQMLQQLEGSESCVADEDDEGFSEIGSLQELLAQREALISELQNRLDEKTSESAEYDKKLLAIDQDEVVANARKEIEQLKAQLQDTLRKSEVEISVQRAKLARERSELDEMRMEVDRRSKDFTPAEPGVKQQKRNWFSRLGLDREQK